MEQNSGFSPSFLVAYKLEKKKYLFFLRKGIYGSYLWVLGFKINVERKQRTQFGALAVLPA